MTISLQAQLQKIEIELDNLYESDDDKHAPRIRELEEEANRLAEEISQVEDAHKRRMEEEDQRRREEDLKRRITSKCGDYLQWLSWAESLYPITQENNEYTFTSNARNWKDGHTYGPYRSKIEALERIEELINYKIYDRNRGRGDINEDLKNFDN